MYPVFTHMKGESYHRQLRSLLCLWRLPSTNELPCLLIWHRHFRPCSVSDCTKFRLYKFRLYQILMFSFCSPAQFTSDKVVLWTDSYNIIIHNNYGKTLIPVTQTKTMSMFFAVTFCIWNVIWAKTSFGLLHFKWHTQNYSINDTPNYCHKWHKLLP